MFPKPERNLPPLQAVATYPPERDPAFDPAVGRRVGPPGKDQISLPVRLAGGEVAQRLVPDDCSLVHIVRRLSPESSWYAASLSATSPARFVIATERVPKGSEWLVRDYEFIPYAFSNNGGARPILDGSFSDVIGWQLTVQSSNRSFFEGTDIELVPTTNAGVNTGASPTRTPSGAVRPTPLQNRQNAAQQGYASLASAGGPVLLQEQQLVSPRDEFFARWAGNEAVVQMAMVLLGPIPTPLAFVEARLTGYQVASNVAEMWRQNVRVQ